MGGFGGGVWGGFVPRIGVPRIYAPEECNCIRETPSKGYPCLGKPPYPTLETHTCISPHIYIYISILYILYTIYTLSVYIYLYKKYIFFGKPTADSFGVCSSLRADATAPRGWVTSPFEARLSVKRFMGVYGVTGLVWSFRGFDRVYICLYRVCRINRAEEGLGFRVLGRGVCS